MPQKVPRPRRVSGALIITLVGGLLSFAAGTYFLSGSDKFWGAFLAVSGLAMVGGALGVVRGKRTAHRWAVWGLALVLILHALIALLLVVILLFLLVTGETNTNLVIGTGIYTLFIALLGYAYWQIRGTVTHRYLWAATEAELNPSPSELADEGADEESEFYVESGSGPTEDVGHARVGGPTEARSATADRRSIETSAM